MSQNIILTWTIGHHVPIFIFSLAIILVIILYVTKSRLHSITRSRGGNRPDQTLIGLSLFYENFYKFEPGLWSIIGRFSWPDLAYLKVWTDLKAYFQTYFTLRPSNRLNKP